MTPVLIIPILLWLFVGISGYFMMYLCDTATGEKLCQGNFFIVDTPVLGVLYALILAPLAFFVGITALLEWKKYTQFLRAELLKESGY